jgi:hypothetical protein
MAANDSRSGAPGADQRDHRHRLDAAVVYRASGGQGAASNLVVINALRAAGDARHPVAAGAASMVLVLAAGSWLPLAHATHRRLRRQA